MTLVGRDSLVDLFTELSRKQDQRSRDRKLVTDHGQIWIVGAAARLSGCHEFLALLANGNHVQN